MLPNYLSLLIVIPTALLMIIGNQNKTLIYKLLSNFLFKYLGLWSFSIYLIHWVILAFYKYINGLQITFNTGFSIVIASILLGGLSYYYIEQTFRFRKWPLILALIVFILIPFSFTKLSYRFSDHKFKQVSHLAPTWVYLPALSETSNIVLWGG
ncbi:putative acyltransferase family protein [Candidatus Hepatincolaceae symbiont of Richtersius coronifer]